jgi:dephospho-CoA kinase
MFAARGATIVDADRIARAVVEPGTPALAAIVERFGDVLDASNALDRRKLGRRVFDDDAARADLEAIVHPAVARVTAERIAEAAEAGVELLVYDVPLLFENRLEKSVEAVVVVAVSPERQRERIRARDDLTDDEIEARIAAQLPLEEKVRRADYVIDNDGSLEQTERRVDEVFAAITSERKEAR